LKVSKHLQFLSLAAIAALSFGCGKNKEMGSALLNMVNAQCQQALDAQAAKISLQATGKLTVRLSVTEIETACKTAVSYKCSARIFNTTVSNGVSTETQCSGLDALNKPCLAVESHKYNTSHMLDRAPASDFESGGDYNKSEFQCHNEALPLDATSLLGEGASLDAALSQAFTKCLSVRSGGES
jgi:hypothetical protein